MSRRLLIACVVMLASMSGPAAAAEGNLSPGVRAPDFTLPTLDGNSVTLSNYFRSPAKVVILNLWAASSVPCRAQTPSLAELNKRYTGKGAVVVGVALDVTKSKVKSFVRERGIDYTIALDPRAQKLRDSYKLYSVPVVYVIDKKGIIRFVHSGFPSNVDEQKKLISAIDAEVKKLVGE